MRIRRSVAVLAGALLAAGTGLAEQHTEAPKPGPEVKKLDAFAGKWKGESEFKPGPWGPGGKMTSDDDCTWFEGGFQLICRGDATGVMGKMKTEAILGWNGEEKVYKYMGFDSSGMMGAASGTVSGNTWTWNGEDKMGGKTIKSRYTIVLTSPTTQNFKWEASDDGGKTWTTAAEGKSTKK
jgi:hypothetical protein